MKSRKGPLALLAACSACLIAACAMPGSKTPSASSPPSVLLSNYNGSFSYTVDAGSSPKNVYFVFNNTSLDTSATSGTVANSIGAIKVDGNEIAQSGAQPVGGPSASSRSLRDFLARSNRDIGGMLNGSGAQTSAGHSIAPVTADNVGDTTSTFFDVDNYGNSVRIPSATCRYVSPSIATPQGSRVLSVWVADDCWSVDGATEGGAALSPSSPSKKHVVTKVMVNALAAKFLTDGTNDIFGYDTAILGAEWGNVSMSGLASRLVPFNGEITILLSDIGQDNSDSGGIVGYFWAGNNFLPAYEAGSNGRIMFVIDAVMYANPNADGSSSMGGTGWAPTNYWAEEVFSTLAHEFQHMIQFYQKGIVLRGDGESADTWINEMCSQLIEDLVADKLGVKGPRGVSSAMGDAGPTGNIFGRIPTFNRYLSYQLDKISPQNGPYNVEDYSFSYAFGSWLMRNYGGANFVKNVVYDLATDSTCVLDAVTKASGKSLSMADLITRWAVAVLGSERTDMPPGYVFNTGGWTTSTAGGPAIILARSIFSIMIRRLDPLPGRRRAGRSLPRRTSTISPRAASPDPRPGAWTCLRA